MAIPACTIASRSFVLRLARGVGLGDDGQHLGARPLVLDAEGDHPAGDRAGHPAHRVLDVLGVDVVPGDDDDVLLPPDDVVLPLVREAESPL